MGLSPSHGDPPECWTWMAQEDALQVGYYESIGKPALHCPMITSTSTSSVDAHST